MRVVLINTLPWDSSITKHTVAFANALSKKAEVLLILKDEQIWQKLNVLDKKIEVCFIKIPRIFHPRNTVVIFDIINIIKKFNPDIIDLRSGYPWLCLLLPFISKYPLIVAFSTAKPRKGEKDQIHYKIYYNIMAKSANQIITFGQIYKSILANRFGLLEDKISIVPFGNYAEVYSHNGIKDLNDKYKYILFFGRIVKYKGLEFLIKAQPFISEEIPMTKIIIAGSCDNFQYYESMITDKDSFIIHNCWLREEIVIDLIKKANVVVLPYIEYSESGNVQLAFTFRKPIVATNLGNFSGYIIDGETGFFVPPKNPKELAKAIIKILKNENLAKKMGENGYNLMKEKFSWDEIVFQTIDIYQNAIRSH